MRRSELVALTLLDVEEQADGLLVTIRRSKTDQEGLGRQVALPFGSNPETCPVRAYSDWLEAELADTLDEDYELELSEPALSDAIRKIYRNAHPTTIPRLDYFRALLSLQAELIKLQD